MNTILQRRNILKQTPRIDATTNFTKIASRASEGIGGKRAIHGRRGVIKCHHIAPTNSEGIETALQLNGAFIFGVAV